MAVLLRIGKCALFSQLCSKHCFLQSILAHLIHLTWIWALSFKGPMFLPLWLTFLLLLTLLVLLLFFLLFLLTGSLTRTFLRFILADIVITFLIILIVSFRDPKSSHFIILPLVFFLTIFCLGSSRAFHDGFFLRVLIIIWWRWSRWFDITSNKESWQDKTKRFMWFSACRNYVGKRKW